MTRDEAGKRRRRSSIEGAQEGAALGQLAASTSVVSRRRSSTALKRTGTGDSRTDLDRREEEQQKEERRRRRRSAEEQHRGSLLPPVAPMAPEEPMPQRRSSRHRRSSVGQREEDVQVAYLAVQKSTAESSVLSSKKSHRSSRKKHQTAYMAEQEVAAAVGEEGELEVEVEGEGAMTAAEKTEAEIDKMSDAASDAAERSLAGEKQEAGKGETMALMMQGSNASDLMEAVNSEEVRAAIEEVNADQADGDTEPDVDLNNMDEESEVGLQSSKPSEIYIEPVVIEDDVMNFGGNGAGLKSKSPTGKAATPASQGTASLTNAAPKQDIGSMFVDLKNHRDGLALDTELDKKDIEKMKAVLIRMNEIKTVTADRLLKRQALLKEYKKAYKMVTESYEKLCETQEKLHMALAGGNDD